jgi:hypothetical protein
VVIDKSNPAVFGHVYANLKFGSKWKDSVRILLDVHSKRAFHKLVLSGSDIIETSEGITSDREKCLGRGDIRSVFFAIRKPGKLQRIEAPSLYSPEQYIIYATMTLDTSQVRRFKLTLRRHNTYFPSRKTSARTTAPCHDVRRVVHPFFMATRSQRKSSQAQARARGRVRSSKFC